MRPNTTDASMPYGLDSNQSSECVQADDDGISFAAFHRLCAAVCAGDTAAATQALSAGAQVNDRQADGKTPLMLAARANRAPMVMFLHALGANLNVSDNHGDCALFHALHAQPTGGSCMIDTVRTLLLMGADCDVQDELGIPFTNYLPDRFSGHQLQDLLHQGLNFGKLSPDGDGFLHLFALHTQSTATEARRIIADAVAHGALINGLDSESHTPLDVALHHNLGMMAEALRFHGAKTSDQLANEPEGTSHQARRSVR